MNVDKMSISVNPQLGDDVRDAARRAGTSVSAWLADAAGAKLRREALAEFLADWQDEHGVITADELARARKDLGYSHHVTDAA